VGGWWFIADWPSKAKFITEDERAFLNARLKEDSDATANESFTWGNVAQALKDPKVWLYCALYHSLSLPLYTLSLFLVSPFPTHEPPTRTDTRLSPPSSKL
jgi:hypothetical protein